MFIRLRLSLSLTFIFITFAMVLAFQNCSGPSVTSPSSSALSSPTSTALPNLAVRPAVEQVDIGGVASCDGDDGLQKAQDCHVLADWPQPAPPVLIDQAQLAPVPWSNVPAIWKTIAKNYDTLVFNGVPTATGARILHWNNLPNYNLTNLNYPLNNPGFGIDVYFANTSSNPSSEGIVAMGALVGGTLGGLDYSAKAVPNNPGTINFVRLAKKFFSVADGYNLQMFSDNVPGSPWGQFWYEITPNIMGCQLAGLYGNKADQGADANEPSLQAMCEQAVQRWDAAADSLQNQFSYQGIALLNNANVVINDQTNATQAASLFQPFEICSDANNPKIYAPWNVAINPVSQSLFPTAGVLCVHDSGVSTQFQSDAAAGIAYMNFHLFEQTGTTTYRSHAESAFQFLDQLTYNPNYEILLVFGTLAAARMNAEYGDQHPINQYLNWIFSESDVRYVWTMLSGSWGGVPVYGLVGDGKHSVLSDTCTTAGCTNPMPPAVPTIYQGNGSSQDSIMTAVILAPIVRYQPQFAAAIGKYLTHLATNALALYPMYMANIDPETKAVIAGAGQVNYGTTTFDFTNLLKASIPFEGLLSRSPAGTPLDSGVYAPTEPYANGPALGWGYSSNLAVYGGTFTGGLGAMLNATDTPGIMQIDLVVTDLPKPKALPTYLLYNPYSTDHSVAFSLDLARRANPLCAQGSLALYDLVTKKILAQNLAGSTDSIAIPAGQARVVTVIPMSESLQTSGKSLQTVKSKIVVDYAYSP